MSASFQPIYDVDSLTLKLQATGSPLWVAGISATDAIYCGASNWTIQIPNSLTGATGGYIKVQANNSNFIEQPISSPGAVQYPTNPLLDQPSMGTRNLKSWRSAFTGSWVDVATLSAQDGYALVTVSNTPVRWVRLSGPGLSAVNFIAYLWTDACSRGN